MAISGLLCGCASTNPAEAEARRMEELRQANPALYETERAQKMRDRDRDEGYQDSVQNRR